MGKKDRSFAAKVAKSATEKTGEHARGNRLGNRQRRTGRGNKQGITERENRKGGQEGRTAREYRKGGQKGRTEKGEQKGRTEERTERENRKGEQPTPRGVYRLKGPIQKQAGGRHMTLMLAPPIWPSLRSRN